MTAYLFYLLLGSGAGAIIAAFGLGLVVTYQGSGIVNFAYGGMATWVAYVYADLRQGSYPFPIPGLPARYHFGDDAGFEAAGRAEDSRDQANVIRFRHVLQIERGIATLDAELAALYEADQSERRDPNADWDAVSKNDAARRQRVEALVSAGRARQATDYVHAAMVFQHGDDVPTILKARDWAMKAVQLDPDDDHARWLVAASTDRALMYAGRPQRYGTQFSRDATTGQWVLWDVDPAVTDAERLEWAVPTLAAARAKVVELNRR